jgi:uncharacterized phage-associated protein
MERVHDIAHYICTEYKRLSGEPIDEMKLHKLLYYTQRESLAILNKPMFSDAFEGWKFGPVCKPIRIAFVNGQMIGIEFNDISAENEYIVRNVLEGYAAIASWKLSEMSHRESSWINARKGLDSNDDGAELLQLSDIKIDAQKVKPYDYLFNMHYDEFDDESWFESPESVTL